MLLQFGQVWTSSLLFLLAQSSCISILGRSVAIISRQRSSARPFTSVSRLACRDSIACWWVFLWTPVKHMVQQSVILSLIQPLYQIIAHQVIKIYSDFSNLLKLRYQDFVPSHSLIPPFKTGLERFQEVILRMYSLKYGSAPAKPVPLDVRPDCI